MVVFGTGQEIELVTVWSHTQAAKMAAAVPSLGEFFTLRCCPSDRDPP